MFLNKHHDGSHLIFSSPVWHLVKCGAYLGVMLI